MKRLKFFSFLVAVVLMAMSLTSCLNGDNTRSGSSWAYISQSMGTMVIKSLDGKTTFSASNAQAISSYKSGLYIIYYNLLSDADNNSNSGSSAVQITLTGLQMIDNTDARPIPETIFNQPDTLTTSTNKWQEASFINVVGYDLYSSSSLDFSSTTYKFPVDRFAVAPSSPRLILGMNYGTAIIGTNKLAPHRFYLTYDPQNYLQDGTLTLTLKHYIATKDITSTSSPEVIPAISTNYYSQTLYAFDLSQFYNAGNYPTKIRIKINKDEKGWLKGDNTKEAELVGESSLVEGSTTNKNK